MREGTRRRHTYEQKKTRYSTVKSPPEEEKRRERTRGERKRERGAVKRERESVVAGSEAAEYVRRVYTHTHTHTYLLSLTRVSSVQTYARERPSERASE